MNMTDEEYDAWLAKVELEAAGTEEADEEVAGELISFTVSMSQLYGIPRRDEEDFLLRLCLENQIDLTKPIETHRILVQDAIMIRGYKKEYNFDGFHEYLAAKLFNEEITRARERNLLYKLRAPHDEQRPYPFPGPIQPKDSDYWRGAWKGGE